MGTIDTSTIRRSAVWLTIYAACLLLVCSFVFFEVLDVDGSDFPVPTNQVAIKVTEESNDVRRAGLQPGLLNVLMTALIAALAWVQSVKISTAGDVARLNPNLVPIWQRSFPIALPRSSLADTPHST